MNFSTQQNVTNPTRTVLVLGGGGSAGNAWLIGVVAGLYEAGLDVSDADVTIGTSAGSTAAAQLVGANPAELLADICAAGQAQPQDRAQSRTGGGAAKSVEDHLERSRRLIASSADAADMRRRFGVAAIDLASDHAPPERWRAMVAPRFSAREWPERRVLITAVNAGTGEPVVFDRHSGVELVDAVAASCSSGSAYRIGDGQYIGWGYRTNAENADLAAGCDRVLVLSPFGGQMLSPPSWGLDLAMQVSALRADGSAVEAVFPCESTEHLLGANAMDLLQRLPAAESRREQGAAFAGRLAEFWRQCKPCSASWFQMR